MVLLTGIGAILTVGFLTLLGHVSWAAVFNVSMAVSVSELREALGVAWIGFVLTLPLGVAMGASQGFQLGYLSNLWSGLTSVTALLALVLAIKVDLGLPGLIGAAWLARLFCTAGCATQVFWFRLPEVRPHPALVSGNATRRLMSLGGRYFVGQLAGIALFYSQPLVVSQMLGPDQVGVFSIAQRVLTLPLNVVQMLTFPLMPAYGEARARGDWPWIRRALKSALASSILIVVGMSVPLSFGCRMLVARWAGSTLVPEVSLVIALTAYTIVNAMVTPISVMLYGVERLSGQATIAVGNALVTVLASIWLAGHYGLTGVGIAMGLGMLIANAPGQLVELRRVVSYSYATRQG